MVLEARPNSSVHLSRVLTGLCRGKRTLWIPGPIHPMGISFIPRITEGSSLWRLTEQLLQVQISERDHGSDLLDKSFSEAEQKVECKGWEVLPYSHRLMPLMPVLGGDYFSFWNFFTVSLSFSAPWTLLFLPPLLIPPPLLLLFLLLLPSIKSCETSLGKPGLFSLLLPVKSVIFSLFFSSYSLPSTCSVIFPL